MSKEDLDLLFEDLSMRLRFGVRGLHRGKVQTLISVGRGWNYMVEEYSAWFSLNTVIFKPLLRSRDSMTDSEWKEYEKTLLHTLPTIDTYRWLLANGFDFLGLIEKNLAIDISTV